MRISHRVTVTDAHAHLVTIETTVASPEPLPDPLELFMAVWTPGSYLVREYARHVEALTCVGGHPTRKVRKNAWVVAHGGAHEVVVRYRLYCGDLTVRTNHVDASHLFLNGAATFLAVASRLDAPVEVALEVPEHFRVATALERVDARTLRAPNYDTLVDSPIEAGELQETSFEAVGVAHVLAVWPAGVSEPNLARLVDATRRIVEAEAGLFGGALPHDGYTFLLHLASRGRGGLEHRASCALVAPETSFDSREGFLDLASLVAHEYFHLWNVKRLRPAGLSPYRYEEENYTRLLWWFEGATSYYDWRVLRLTRLCTPAEYLDHLASEVAALEATPGRLVQGLAEASFDAWIKLYRPDENSPNATVSYYRKGELVMAMFDLEIRARTGGRASLDTVLAHLWSELGARELPVPEDAMPRLFAEAIGQPVDDLFARLVSGTEELDVDRALGLAGLRVERTARSDAPVSLGVRTRNEGARVFAVHVLRGSAAQRGGVDANDELVAVDDRRVEGSLDVHLMGRRAGETVRLLVARDGGLRTLSVTLDPARTDKVKIVSSADASAAEVSLRSAWLGE